MTADEIHKRPGPSFCIDSKSIKQSGFTLIEILIVISIFSIIASLCFISLDQYIRVSEGLKAQRERMAAYQSAMALLERDVRYAVNRPVREGGFSGAEPGFLVNSANGYAGEIFRVTTLQADYRQPGTGKISRVAWYIDGDILYRSGRSALDQTESTTESSSVVLQGVTDARVEQYLWTRDTGLQVYTPFGSDAEFPSGVSITLELENGHQLVRTFDLANGL